jgi:hypothetical protein
MSGVVSFLVVTLIVLAAPRGQPALLVPHSRFLSPALSQTVEQPAKSTGSVSGRIVAGDTGRPLRRAQVTLSMSGGGGPPRGASTSLDGRYQLNDLPPGRYILTVRRSGYLAMQFGQVRPNEQPRPLDIGSGQRLEHIDFTLPRMGSILGRVLDDGGEPLAGAIVWAMRPIFLEGRRQLVVASGGLQGTDDLGQFKLTDLPPGSYYVRAMSRETWTVVTKSQRQLMGFSPTFHPGTQRVGEARLVEVSVGQQVRIGDLMLDPARPAVISGFAFDSKGQPLVGRNVGLMIRYIGGGTGVAAGVGGGGMSLGNSPVAADGSFVFRDVTPGDYEVRVATGNVRDGDGEMARTAVAIDGVDVDNVRLVTSAGWTAAGRIVTEDGGTPAFAAAEMRVASQAIDDVRADGAGVGEVRDDWTFTVRAILGRARLTATVPDGWMVKTIRREERDISEAPLELKSGDVLREIEVVVTNRVTAVAGQLADARGTPLTSGSIVVFADDPVKWGLGSRFVRTVRPDQDGRWEIKGLPAGDYLGVAVDYLEENIWQDPAYLESLRADAERFALNDGAARTLALKVVNVDRIR